MNTRTHALQEFVSALQAALISRADTPQAQRMLEAAFRALTRPKTEGSGDSSRLPPCQYLSTLRDNHDDLPDDLQLLMRAFFEIEPSLAWKKRAGSIEAASENFIDGHANALIIGPGGLERRVDVSIGATVLAPHVRYPDHTHPPEETYLVLSSGRFSHDHQDWVEPGKGGTFYNAPGVTHAMRSGKHPFFAFWVLWSDNR